MAIVVSEENSREEVNNSITPARSMLPRTIPLEGQKCSVAFSAEAH